MVKFLIVMNILSGKEKQKKEYLKKMSEMDRLGIKDPFKEVFENKTILTKEELIEAQRELEDYG